MSAPQGRTLLRTRDATGVEETRETLHGLSSSEADDFDAEWAVRGGAPSHGGAQQQQRQQQGRRGRPGWMRLPGFGGDFGGGGGGGSAGANGGPRRIDIA